MGMTEEELGYRCIHSGVCHDSAELKIVDGQLIWNHHFIERLGDHNQLFSDIYKERIIDAVGKRGWAVFFLQFDQLGKYLVDIYVDDIKNFQPIAAIILTLRPNEMQFEIYHKGDIKQYISNRL